MPVPTGLSEDQYPMVVGVIANRTVASGAFCYATQTVYDSVAAFDLVSGHLAGVTTGQERTEHPASGFE
ncbi:hypothetical protein DL93DRAFT_2092140 [Clavulina sp. PMI_390]|nr:hypothetical protein DL93DRAFT_2092140 [Clavulina sp. PMI_390]